MNKIIEIVFYIVFLAIVIPILYMIGVMLWHLITVIIPFVFMGYVDIIVDFWKNLLH